MNCLLVSACLLGFRCKYNGGSNALERQDIEALREAYRLIPVCPEMAGGLSCPREPCERVDDRVVSAGNSDCTRAYSAGAGVALRLAEMYKCEEALLKERSPSCGNNEVYDGSFRHILVKRAGVTAEKLTASGVSVYGESQILQLKYINNK